MRQPRPTGTPRATGRRGNRRPTVTIKDLPPEHRPRERLLTGGAETLTDVELLALLLGTGDQASGASALDLALRVLRLAERSGTGLRFLAAVRPEELCRIPGVGPAKAARLAAAVEMGRRVQAVTPARPAIAGAEDVVRLVGGQMRHLQREHFRVVLVNTRNRVLATETISIGGLDRTAVHPREVFRAAVERSAAGLIMVHNHPSGDPTPSPDDLAVTRRLVEAGRLMGITVLDHVIIGDGGYVSLRQHHPNWFDEAGG